METGFSKSELQRMTGWWESIKSTATSVWNAAKSAGATVVDWAKAAWAKCLSYANDILTNLSLWWTNFKSRVTVYFNKAKELATTIYACVKTAKAIVTGVIDIIKGIIDRAQVIARIAGGDMVALAQLFVDLLCNFGKFRSAFSALADGIGEANILKKYGKFGQFIGFMLSALVTS